MTSIHGSTPPPHRRFNIRRAVEDVYWRYKRWNGMFDKQIRLLQADERFLNQCAELYSRGYKDWHIVGAVSNTLLNLEGRKNGLIAGVASWESIADKFKEVEYPVEAFLGRQFEWYSAIYLFTCLKNHGFESRGLGYELKAVENFMRQRMKHFEVDIEHTPMFGKPSGWWPELASLEDVLTKNCR